MSTFDELLFFSNERIRATKMTFKRYLHHRIHWESRLIGIKGARGLGKTTLILQYVKQKQKEGAKVLYLSLDNLYFANHSLSETVANYHRLGITIFALDEVHKYAYWSAELKFLYDQYPDVQLLFTGSSIMDIAKEEFDLSRRAAMYEMFGLSFREFLALNQAIELKPVSFINLVDHSSDVFELFPEDFKPYAYFQEYLQYGYYPFYFEDKVTFKRRLNQVIRLITEYDMAELEGFDIRNAKKIQLLLSIVAQSVPFTPNITKLAERSGIHRNSVMNYLHYLEQAQLVSLLYQDAKGITALQKPEKLYLQNTNLAHVLSDETPDVGNIRETFLLSQLRVDERVSYVSDVDFLVNGKINLEVGGRNKKKNQIKSVSNAFLVLDNIDSPVLNRIPLWMFGLLY